MITWSKHPLIYEINTWVWLRELGQKRNEPLTLATVPDRVWDDIASLGFDAVWLMGVWERSPAGIRVAMANQGLLDDFCRALPDFREEDNVGSPYCIRGYEVDAGLGGRKGLAIARAELARRGLRLILDFVPNHVAPDHPWVTGHPEYFIQGECGDAVREPTAFLTTAGRTFACGRDPFFPAWPDVLQLNAFHPGLRAAVGETLSSIADQCDGVRCDMAMLMMNDIFQRTWGERAGNRPSGEYWTELIAAIRARHPGFLFMAEAYWELEWELQQQGFDFCYDKKLYDRLEHGPGENVRLHLCADMAYQERLVRFIENHDEPRAAATFPPNKERSVALLAATLPGAALLHEGQLEGRRVRLPVFLGRRPAEAVDDELRAFYRTLLRAVVREKVRHGRWHLCERSGWPDNASHLNLVAHCWCGERNRHLIVVNLSDGTSQARIRLPGDDVRGRAWRLVDLLTGETWERDGDEMGGIGLYIDLGPWKRNFFRLEPL